MFAFTISGAVMRLILFATSFAISVSLCAHGIALARNDTTMSGKRLATTNALGERIASGVFLRMEEGDHFYFGLRSAGGGEETFIILRKIGDLAAFTKNPIALAGRKVNLRWIERMVNISEAGGRI